MKTQNPIIRVLLVLLFPFVLNGQQNVIITQIDSLENNSAIVTITNAQKTFFSRYLVLEPPFDFIVPSGILSTENTTNQYPDYLLSNINFPDDVSGSFPRDVIYLPSKQQYYVYSGRKVVIIDGLTQNKIGSVNVSASNVAFTTRVVNMNPEKRIAFNNNQTAPYIYVATEDCKLVVINYITNEIVNEIIPVIAENEENYKKASVAFQQANEKGVWYLSQVNNSDVYSRIGKLEGNSETGYLEINDFGINDITLSEDGNLFAVSSTNGIYIYDINDFSQIYHFIAEVNTGALLWKNNQLYIDLIDDEKIGIYDFNISPPAFYEINDLPYNYILKFEPHPGVASNHVYVTANESNTYYFGIIDGSLPNPVNVDQFELEFVTGLAFNPNNGHIYCSGLDFIKYYDATNYSLTGTIYLDGSYSYDLAISDLPTSVLTIQPVSGNVMLMEENGFNKTNLNFAGSIISGCMKEQLDKSYFAVTKNNFNSYLMIVNNKTFEVENIQIPYFFNVEHISCNQNDNLLYLAGKTEDINQNEVYQIIEYNCVSSSFTYDCLFQVDNKIKRILSGPNNKLYSFNSDFSDGDGKLEIFELPLGNNHKTIDLGYGICYSDIKYYDGRLFIVSKCSQNIIVLDGTTDLPSYYPAFSYNSDEAWSITYDPVNNHYYVGRHNGKISKYQINLFQFAPEEVYTIDNFNHPNPVDNIFFNELEMKVYGFSSEDSRIDIIKNLEDPLSNWESLSIESYYNSDVVFNNANNRLYIFQLFSDANKSFVKTLDCSTDEFENDNVYTGNGHANIPGFMEYKYNNSSVLFDEERNYIFTSNHSFSNISIINGFTDNLTLKAGWNWLSFPRLQRYQNEPDLTTSVLSRIDVFPVKLHLEYMDENNSIFVKDYDPDNYPPWTGNLNEIISSQGYKLQLDLSDGSTPNIKLYGAVADPATEITIYTDQYPSQGIENWMGYFMPYPQDVEDCIPVEVMDDLYMIKTQRWTMVKFSGDTWFTYGRKTPLKYGDMVIFKTHADHTFAWVSSGNEKEEQSIDMTEFYTYEEKASYLPVYVEFDPASDVQEIAIIANGQVKGAAVRYPGDTLVEVNAYLEGTPPGSPLEFETWSGYKSTSTGIGDYLVLNQKNRIKEGRKMYSGEAVDAQLVSLKKQEIEITPAGIHAVKCIPNPFSDQTTLSFRLAGQQTLWVEIHNINGTKIKTLLEGVLPGGYYETKWFGDNESGNKVKNGIYFYKIRTDKGTVISDKIVLIH